MEADGVGRLMTEEKGKGDKRDNPFSVYAVASQIGFMVILPLLLFISSVGSYLLKLTKKYGKPNVPKMSEIHHDTKDHDYYDD